MMRVVVVDFINSNVYKNANVSKRVFSINNIQHLLLPLLSTFALQTKQFQKYKEKKKFKTSKTFNHRLYFGTIQREICLYVNNLQNNKEETKLFIKCCFAQKKKKKELTS